MSSSSSDDISVELVEELGQSLEDSESSVFTILTKFDLKKYITIFKGITD